LFFISNAGVQIQLDPDLLERLDKLAELDEMTRYRLIQNMLYECTASLETSRKVGVLKTALQMRNMGEVLRKWGEKLRKQDIDLNMDV
jgi:predicted transcriptional regulator